MNTLSIIILTLIVYSLLAIVIYFLLGENEDTLEFFGLGIVGWILLFVFNFIVMPIGDFIRYYNKRSIFKEESTGNKYICNLKDTEDIYYWTEGYKLLKRYAPKSEWEGMPYFDKEFVKNSKINCNHCKHDKVCDHGGAYVKCKHDEWGTIVEFDKFEKNKKGRK